MGLQESGCSEKELVIELNQCGGGEEQATHVRTSVRGYGKGGIKKKLQLLWATGGMLPGSENSQVLSPPSIAFSSSATACYCQKPTGTRWTRESGTCVSQSSSPSLTEQTQNGGPEAETTRKEPAQFDTHGFPVRFQVPQLRTAQYGFSGNLTCIFEN